MASGSVSQGATGNQDIDGVLSGQRWDSTSITYNFPTLASYYGAGYNGDNNEPAGFQAVSASFQAMVRDALAQYASVANLTFTEVGPGAASNISVARTSNLGSFNGYGYNPGPNQRNGDAWFASSTTQVGDTEVRGRGTWRLVMHELGHSLGLKHGHEAGGPANTAMTVQHDDNDYSIMSYRRTPGGATSGVAPETFGNPQSLMMYDIAAVQAMYGANYSTQSGDSVYTWDPATGQELINGVAQVAPGANRIYATIWDGGGTDTYDLSNYTNGVSIDLTPGGSSTFSRDQLAVVDAASGARASANIFNALLYNGDTRSLIENARGGSGNDVINGNDAANTLIGAAGADSIAGGNGNDVLEGDAGDDVIVGGGGDDTAVYSGARSNYTATLTNGVLRIADTTGTDGTDTVREVEFFRFADRTVTLAELLAPPTTVGSGSGGGNGGATLDQPGGLGSSPDPTTGAPRAGGSGATAAHPSGGGGGSAGGGVGGTGGTGSDATGTLVGGAGGTGGANGIGVRTFGSGSNSDSAVAGNGGNGADAGGTAAFPRDNAGGGGGGEGGYGLILTGTGGANAQFINSGDLTGGNGGGGGFGLQAGSGGAGGIAIDVLGTGGLRLVNTGILRGGDGGTVGGSNYPGSGNTAGAGGAGIVGRNLTILQNGGAIVGGVSGDATPVQADAVTFTGGTNQIQFSNAVPTAATFSGGIGVSGSLTINTQFNQIVDLGNVIHDGPAGAGSLTFQGRTRLTGASTYSGPTTVNNATLLVDGSIASSVTAQSGNVAGSGRIGGSVTLTSGTVGANQAGAPLANSIGTLTIGGNLTFDNASNLVEGVASADSYDQLVVSGDVNLANAFLDLNLAPGATTTSGQSITLIDNRGQNAVAGNFRSSDGSLQLTEGTTVAENGRSYRISYRGGDGNDVTITDVTGGTPTPTPPVYTIAVDPASGPEGTPPGAGTTFTFTVTRAGDVSQAGSVAIGLGGTADTPEQPGADYTVSGLTNGVLNFLPGASQATFTVVSRPGTGVEPDETVVATLGTITGGGTLGATTSATATILNDDGVPTSGPVYQIAVTPASGPEDGTTAQVSVGRSSGEGAGDPALQPTRFTYTVTRSGDASQVGSVAIALAGTATGPGQGGADYTVSGLTNGALNFAAGQTSASFTVTATPDSLFESDETVIATLGSVTGGGGIGAQASATATIVNDDPAPSLALSAATYAASEGTGTGGQVAVTITRSGDAQAPQTVLYLVSGTGPNPADAADFVGGAFPSGSVTFAQGETSRTFVLQFAGDATPEPDETALLTLSSPNFGTITQGSAVVTLLNDDSGPGPGPAPDPVPEPGPVGPTPYDDNLVGTDGADLISLLSGNDRYSGLRGNDTVFGNEGSDTVFGNEGNDLLLGNQGEDLLFGNQGNDTLFGGQGADTLFGGQDADLLLGNLGTDVLLGNLGNDTLYGGQGADTLYGGQGDDVLFGDLGNDVLYGDLGNDVLAGGAGADRYVFNVNSGSDAVLGFNAAEGDRLDLRGQTYTFGTAADGSGSALLVLSGGGTIELAGITQAQVNASFFA